MNAEAQKLIDEVGIEGIRSNMRIMQLNLQQRKMIEIVKAYQYHPDILIVDETTNALSHRERQVLFDLIKRLTAEGRAVIIISHDIEEVMEYLSLIHILSRLPLHLAVVRPGGSPGRERESPSDRQRCGGEYADRDF